MSRATNLFLLAVAVTLIFNSGCKDKNEPDAIPQKEPPKNSQPSETITSAPRPAPETPAAQPVVEEEKPAAPVSVVSPVIDNEKPADSAHNGWMTDYKAAMKKAAAEKKDMLLDFSGSDWCGWCIRLDKEVFDHKEFMEVASKDFVFVMLDFPRNKSLAPELKAQNEQLQKKYGQQGFPSVYLTDARGRPYALTGYEPGGVKAYLKNLSQLREKKIKFDRLMTKARSAQLEGFEKAKLVDEAIRLLPSEMIVNFYREEIEKIIALDSENKAGLRDRHSVNLVLWDAGQLLNVGNVDKAIELVDKAIKELKPKGEIAQEVYYYKAIVLDAKGDKPATLASLNKAIEVAPETEMAVQIKEIIKNNFTEEKPE